MTVMIRVSLVPCADGVLKSDALQYLELNASSRALTPRAYNVPLVVIAHSGIPPGLTLAPGRRMESYELFLNRLFDINPSLIKAVE
jgi:hypothetical protein